MGCLGGWLRHARRRLGEHPRGIAPAALLAMLRWMRGWVHGFYAVAGVLLSAGLLLALLGLWAVSGLTEGVLEGETRRFDEAVLLWMDTQASPVLDAVALRVTALGDALVVAAIALIAGTLLWLLERRGHAALLWGAVGGMLLIVPVLKALFDRPRPELFEWRAHSADASSYPSGHAALSVVLLVALTYVVHRLSGRRWVEVVTALLAGLAVLLVGLSRLYLGVHYPSDVLAGYVVGFAWAVFCALAVEGLCHQRRARLQAQPPSRAPSGARGDLPP